MRILVANDEAAWAQDICLLLRVKYHHTVRSVALHSEVGTVVRSFIPEGMIFDYMMDATPREFLKRVKKALQRVPPYVVYTCFRKDGDGWKRIIADGIPENRIVSIGDLNEDIGRLLEILGTQHGQETSE